MGEEINREIISTCLVYLVTSSPSSSTLREASYILLILLILLIPFIPLHPLLIL
jgi:hypothetical protein